MRKKKRQRGFKQAPKKFFYKEDVFLSRMASILKTPQSKVKEMFFQRPLPSIKLNGASKAALEKKGFELKEVEWAENTYIVKNQTEFAVKKASEYKKGLFYVQNLAEMIPTVALNIKPDDLVLDVYPEPSSAHLLSLGGDEEKIFVNRNTQMGEDLDKEHANSFDKILLVSPSSREGKISFFQKRPLKNWSIQKTKVLSRLQEKLICVGFNCLKKGGLLAYSTTTLSPNENEAIVSYLLKKNKDAVIENIELIESKEFRSYKPFIQKGLKEWNNEVFHPDVVKTIRTIPGKTMYGTYTAVIRKV
jgi:tRNA (cytosine49-C5)-methyltransferase